MVKVTGILGTASEVLYKERYMHIKSTLPSLSQAQTMYRFQRPSLFQLNLMY